MLKEGRCAPRLIALITLILGIGLGPAFGQFAAPEPWRIGVILPKKIASPNAQTSLIDAVAEAARMGATLAQEELGLNAELLGRELVVETVTAADGDEALAQAERLVDGGAFALVGGFGVEAEALSAFAEARQMPFINIGSPSDALRNEACARYTFHVEASAAMYLDALAGWFVRSGFRRWFFVYADDAAGEALYQRARRTLSERHFGAQETGEAAVSPALVEPQAALAAIERARADVVLMLLEPAEQLEFLRAYEAAGLEPAVTGFPYPAAQTRTFFAASVSAAPRAGVGYRATSWEATLDAYGARELNARFAARWGQPMDPPAWAAYQAVKILYEAALAAGTEGSALVEYLESPLAVFDVWKGIGVTFRPWDHQLRQSLFLVKIDPEAETAWDLAALVGELPAIYMPRTDPVERLDQLGDLETDSQCDF